MKRALFLDASDEEASLMFKNMIQRARKSVAMRKMDNFFHGYNNYKKDKRQKKTEKDKESAKKNL